MSIKRMSKYDVSFFWRLENEMEEYQGRRWEHVHTIDIFPKQYFIFYYSKSVQKSLHQFHKKSHLDNYVTL